MPTKSKKPQPARKPARKPVTETAAAQDTQDAQRRKPRRQPATQKQQIEMVQFVGDRLRQARELNGLTVSEAARRFGFANGGSLSKLENGKHVTAIPLWVIAKASGVYEVSVDYFFGLTDDVGAQVGRIHIGRDASTWLQALLERNRMRDIETLALVHAQIVGAIEGQRTISIAIQDLEKAIGKFKEMHPRFAVRFSLLKGGAPVEYHLKNTIDACMQVTHALSKFKQTAKAARGVASGADDSQMQLIG